MFPRIALGIWLAVALVLVVAAIFMRLFKLSSGRDLGKQVAGAIIWPVLLFSAPGRRLLISIIRLTNIDYTPEFEHAVEQKVIAQQKAIEEQNRTVQVREQAAQKVETAKGNAEATVLNAKAEAESIRIRANALEANAKLVEWEAVQKWNGQMPTHMMGGAMPFIQIPTK